MRLAGFRRLRYEDRVRTIGTSGGVALGVALMSVTLHGQPPTTGIAQCDEYYAAIASCLPQMCGAERSLIETELSFHEEVLSKTIELKGRAAAADACSQDLQKEIQTDPYGCYASQRAKAGLPTTSIHDVNVLPASSAVTISFKLGPQTSKNGRPEVQIASEDLQTEARYLPAESNGAFRLDTAVDRPASPSGESAAFVLEPERSYCFAIKSADGQERRGTFTTSSR
jgi:hypothetical protein